MQTNEGKERKTRNSNPRETLWPKKEKEEATKEETKEKSSTGGRLGTTGAGAVDASLTAGWKFPNHARLAEAEEEVEEEEEEENEDEEKNEEKRQYEK